MITSIHIKNFQSHKNSKLEFDPGVNIITGPTDSGKSGFKKALTWLINNRPSGNSLRSFWGGKTEVKLFTDEGVVVRSKDKIEEYILGLHGGEAYDEIVFKAFGTNVPEEISKFLNVNPINIQSQLDSHFLLSETPGAVASHFNKVARLDKIDTATANINKWVRELNSDLSYLGKDLKKKEEDIQQYAYLPKFEIELDVLEEMDKQETAMIASVKRLNNLMEEIEKVKTKINKKEEMLPMGLLVDNVLSIIENKKSIEKQKEGLINLLSNIECVQLEIKQKEHLLTAESNIDNLLQLYATKNTKLSALSTLEKTLLTINNINVLLTNANANLSIKTKEFNSNIGEICPLCEQPIINKKHNHK